MNGNGDFSWNEFINDVVKGTTTIIQSTRSPTGEVRTTAITPTTPGATMSNNTMILGLAVVVVLVLVLAK
jgi:hypothetical protein